MYIDSGLKCSVLYYLLNLMVLSQSCKLAMPTLDEQTVCVAVYVVTNLLTPVEKQFDCFI